MALRPNWTRRFHQAVQNSIDLQCNGTRRRGFSAICAQNEVCWAAGDWCVLITIIKVTGSAGINTEFQ